MASKKVEKPKDEKKPEEKIEEEIKIPTPNEKFDYKELYYSQPSQKDKVKKDFTEFTQIDMTLLNKKRERTVDENENNNKLNEDKNINLIEKSKSINKKEKINQFENLKSQNCFRFAIKNKFRKKFLIRNFSDIQQKNCNNCNNNVFTTMTERILNKSQKEIIKNDKHNPIKKINKFKLNFNSLNLYRNPNKIKQSYIRDIRKEEEIDLTNYFKINKSDLNLNHNEKEKNERKGSKTSRIIHTNIKVNYLALF